MVHFAAGGSGGTAMSSSARMTRRLFRITAKLSSRFSLLLSPLRREILVQPPRWNHVGVLLQQLLDRHGGSDRFASLRQLARSPPIPQQRGKLGNRVANELRPAHRGSRQRVDEKDGTLLGRRPGAAKNPENQRDPGAWRTSRRETDDGFDHAVGEQAGAQVALLPRPKQRSRRKKDISAPALGQVVERVLEPGEIGKLWRGPKTHRGSSAAAAGQLRFT